MPDNIDDVDVRWWALLIGQVGVGLVLFFYGDADFGKLLLGSAFGQSVTAKIGPTR